jgi:hypothetical protein
MNRPTRFLHLLLAGAIAVSIPAIGRRAFGDPDTDPIVPMSIHYSKRDARRFALKGSLASRNPAWLIERSARVRDHYALIAGAPSAGVFFQRDPNQLASGANAGLHE